jgi:hypothetical protein
MLGAYLAGAVKTPKTIEEHKSEAEKWERQAGIAQRALLDQAVALSGVSMQLADAIEKARLEKLRTDKETRDLQTEIERLRKELADKIEKPAETKDYITLPSGTMIACDWPGELCLSVIGSVIHHRTRLFYNLDSQDDRKYLADLISKTWSKWVKEPTRREESK